MNELDILWRLGLALALSSKLHERDGVLDVRAGDANESSY